MNWVTSVVRFGLVLALVTIAGPAARGEPVPSTQPPAGIRDKTPHVYALTGARIVTEPGTVLDSATIVIRDGIIESVRTGGSPPADARVRDLSGRTVYAGFFDAYTNVGVPKEVPKSVAEENPYWNDAVTPLFAVGRVFQPDSAVFVQLRSQGFTAVLAAPRTGVVQGTSSVLFLGDPEEPEDLLLLPEAALHMDFHRRSTWPVRSGYPNSSMGGYALARQVFYDADWYEKAQGAWHRNRDLPRPETNEALAALVPYRKGEKKIVIDTRNELYALRADRLAEELDLDIVIRGSGREYRRLDLIREAGHPILVPLHFPQAPTVDSPEEAIDVPLVDLMHWDLAPENPGRLAGAGLTIALTTDGMEDKKEFLSRLRLAVERGLPADAALAALTTAPAEIFGLDRKLGTVTRGKIANLVVADGDLFSADGNVVEVWVEGEPFETQRRLAADPRGEWEALSISQNYSTVLDGKLTIRGKPEQLSGTYELAGRKIRLEKVELLDARLSFQVPLDSLGREGIVLVSGTIADSLIHGTGYGENGAEIRWTARLTRRLDDPRSKKKDREPVAASYPANHPLGAFGRSAPPEQPAVVAFRGGTIWTSGPKGVIENGTVLVRRGKIAEVGSDVSIPSGATIVELGGKHVSPGIIDAHSHMGTDGGINESGQTITAEVRIGDFIDPDDMSIYRQLAGGVTTSHIMHGSANTIGGQCQVIKLRWGAGPEEMKFEDAPKTIKFALGENVKQSNWGDRYTTRYPQTRMGVEQLLRDEFRTALEYKAEWDAWRPGSRGMPPRRDLELDAIVEVLDGERWIHCHAYRQDEILSLMRVCDDFDVQIAVLQHILEGYKVADEIAKRNIGASTFSDRWAYKIEVYDAIPYNGTLMHDVGVVVTFNSDNDHRATRLNTEAAKAVKYGGTLDREALAFVTRNAAVQLRVDDRVGTLEAGKDADLVVWSGSPLSTLTRCEQTWIDGRKYFDREEDLRQRERQRAMRNALVQKIARSSRKGDGEKPQIADRRGEEGYSCTHDDGEVLR